MILIKKRYEEKLKLQILEHFAPAYLNHRFYRTGSVRGFGLKVILITFKVKSKLQKDT